jgi:hypothetical protein
MTGAAIGWAAGDDVRPALAVEFEDKARVFFVVIVEDDPRRADRLECRTDTAVMVDHDRHRVVLLRVVRICTAIPL